MDELKKIIEALGKAFEQFKAANDERLKAIESKGYAPADIEAKVETINKDISSLSAMKAQLEALETVVGRGGNGGSKSAVECARAEYGDAFGQFVRKGSEAGLRDLAIKATMTTQDDTNGGFLISDPVYGPMKEILSQRSAIRGLANVVSISATSYKTLVDQLGETSEDASETSTRNATGTPTFAEVEIIPKEMSAMPKVTQEMLDDPAFNTEAYVGKFLGRTFAAREGTWFWSGNGVKQAKGISSYTMIANGSYAWGKIGFIISGHATLLNNCDKLLDLQHALKVGYRGNGKFLMNDNTLLAIRKLKDGDGNYIWRAGLMDGAPDTLLGKPIAIDDFVDDIGAGKYPIWFGDFNEAYTIVDRFGVRMLRDPFTAKPYVSFYTTKRVGGGIVNYEAIKALKVSA